MASALPPEQQASYSSIIDGILSSSDLNTISAKAIRKGLQEKVDYDLTPQKAAITDLIMERFDKFSTDTKPGAPVEPATSTDPVQPEPVPASKDVVLDRVLPKNGFVHATTNDIVISKPVENTSSPTKSNKRRSSSEDDDEDDLSDIPNTPSPKKVKRTPKKETDEEIAKRMQAELNAGAGRSTRGGGTTRKKVSAKKDKKSSKKKSAARIKAADDSDLDSGSDSSPKPEKEKKGGFHKPMGLSPALQDLLGASQLSRPQTVKQIWAYVKERDLQDPNDKRHIMCDDKLRAVFKTEKVHMFTMNKILAGQLYPIDEV